jgi:hypothetical protein
MVVMLASSPFMALLLLVETTFKTKLLELWQNGIHPYFVLFWLFPQSCFFDIFPK